MLSRVLPYLSVIFPNRVELAGVSGTQDVMAGLQKLHAMGAFAIALKLGSEGSLLYRGGDVQTHAGFSVQVIDTTGAGDAFNAGYLRAMLDGAAPQYRLALGNACGALTAGANGGTGGLKSLAQAQMMFSEDLA
ncbi:carbohydrate kinase family protein [Devosia algicola]|uniref:Carbohydrate kinase family protein n=1 Tax=Devosia algicola TaxID=3026418 RepID=A0ABY7YJB7_9HYPH|nr:carbohydrate kinase family protein [Devosia algicola]WDR01342.1 carbohydrate kinase family protein [Devosia algicola]